MKEFICDNNAFWYEKFKLDYEQYIPVIIVDKEDYLMDGIDVFMKNIYKLCSFLY